MSFGVSKFKWSLHRLVESTLVKIPHFWKLHVVAQYYNHSALKNVSKNVCLLVKIRIEANSVGSKPDDLDLLCLSKRL